MSKNTVKPGLHPTRAKRAKKTVQNAEFDAFTRRILRAYARRVASGDVEALRSLVDLSSELDAVIRLAVAGLHGAPYRYSWSEIADRLGVSRQAAQMRYGERSDRPRLDQRLIEAGLGVSVATLVAVFADHYPGTPIPSACPGCGYRYPDGVTDCPSNATVRPLLVARRHQDQDAVKRLSPAQFADLLSQKTARTNRVAARQATRPTPTPGHHSGDLFDLIDTEDVAS